MHHEFSQVTAGSVMSRLWTGWSRFRFPPQAVDFSLHLNILIIPGDHSDFYSVDAGGSFHGGKVAWSWPVAST